MSQTSRPVKGTGPWTFNNTIFGSNNNDTWSKAVAGGQNGETIHAIWGENVISSLGIQGNIYYSRSTDGGDTYPVLRQIISLIDTSNYTGFGSDNYSIDVNGNTEPLHTGSPFTDVGLLKSIDGGDTWTKTIVQYLPFPFISNSTLTDLDGDGIADTVLTNSGDAHVLIDNNGMCHVWFSAYRLTGDGTHLFTFPGTDGLFYWNESMATDDYVLIAAAEDFNGNGQLDVPLSGFCTVPWGMYGGGLTQMPSAGIDASGTLYVTYQTVVEEPAGDTAFYHQLFRHVFMITSADNGLTWTYPLDIVPSVAQGGNGEYQEAVYASMARTVDANACVLYQRDPYPGNALAMIGSCDNSNNMGNFSDIIFAEVEAATVRVNTVNSENVAVSQNYPNPANGLTSIDINLKKGASVELEVIDILGNVVYTNSRSNAPAGKHTIQINTASWAPGIYAYTVRTGSQQVTKSLIIQ